MKIVTVNIEEAYIEAIKKLVGEGGLYPSRSELIRCAVREFLLRELKTAEKFSKIPDKKNDDEDFEEQEDIVRVPIITRNNKNEPIREFKTYKVIKKLECNNNAKTKNKKKPEKIKDYFFKEEEAINPAQRTPTTLAELRRQNPNLNDYKYINEGDRSHVS